MTITTKFDIGKEARIIALNVKCYIIGIIHDGDGTWYRCTYWHDGERRTEAILEREME